ncbi:preprotein translocase subunit SecG [Massilia sp. PAMC28688]|uniref:preprotein translocase subunit SecG n=1 Tax=Massilia sp. PAMC28688 TaxID=2861283 RepID=UPI001C6251A9|nr:preprotein translocase subunit SecG [Massilia sp. PAMC28688]QYF92390.1 preprotein translocase subunit SecG [Massilia sp. PAMC28688]
MNSLQNLVVLVQVISALAIIILVLLQHGKGADMGAAFGSGASGSLFGASGSSNFMSKLTGASAAVFFVSTLILANFASERDTGVDGGIMERAAQPAPVTGPAAIPQAAPVAPAPAAAVPPAPAATVAPATTDVPAVAPAPAK